MGAVSTEKADTWWPLVGGWQGGWGQEHSQAEHGLHGDVQGRHVEGLKEHLCCLLAVLARVERGFRQKDRMLQEMAAVGMCRQPGP